MEPISAPTTSSTPATYVVAGPPRAPQQAARVEVAAAAAGHAELQTKVTRRSDGVQQVSIVDPVSGAEVFKTPSDAALEVIDAALKMIEARKELGS